MFSFPGVKECIEALKAAGYRIGLASSKPENRVSVFGAFWNT